MKSDIQIDSEKAGEILFIYISKLLSPNVYWSLAQLIWTGCGFSLAFAQVHQLFSIAWFIDFIFNVEIKYTITLSKPQYRINRKTYHSGRRLTHHNGEWTLCGVCVCVCGVSFSHSPYYRCRVLAVMMHSSEMINCQLIEKYGQIKWYWYNRKVMQERIKPNERDAFASSVRRNTSLNGLTIDKNH